jgi:hypothetical protein
MNTIDPSISNPLLRVSVSLRAAAMVKWIIAKPEERHGCLMLGRRGGTYNFSPGMPFVSPTQGIYIRKPCFNDKHMSLLREFRGLVSVDIGDTNVTEQGVSYLLKCKSLRYLFLWGTLVGDAVVDVLDNMAALNMLVLSGSRISRDAFNRVRQRMPETYVCHTVYGDYYRNFEGITAGLQWTRRHEPRSA